MRTRSQLDTTSIVEAFRPVSKKGIAHSVVSQILDLVRTGMLRPGDRLPSERELTQILSVSRPTLREALRALSILGVVDLRHGGGAFVTDLTARTLLAPLDFFLSLSESNLADYFESRRIMELEIVRKAALNATPEDLRDLDELIAAHEKVLSDPVGFRILDSRFHAKLSASAGNVVLERIVYGLYSMGLDIRRRATQKSSLIRQSTNDHKRIVKAIAARDGEKAAREMGIHLDHIEATTREAMGGRVVVLGPRSAAVRRVRRK